MTESLIYARSNVLSQNLVTMLKILILASNQLNSWM